MHSNCLHSRRILPVTQLNSIFSLCFLRINFQLKAKKKVNSFIECEVKTSQKLFIRELNMYKNNIIIKERPISHLKKYSINFGIFSVYARLSTWLPSFSRNFLSNATNAHTKHTNKLHHKSESGEQFIIITIIMIV